MARSKNVTIQDVARAAGVAVSTVSRVLNDKDDVAPDTYQKVRDVIAELGYTSSLAARSMRSRRTGVVGLIMPELEDSFCIQVIKGINQAILALDYDLLAYTSGSSKRTSKAEREQHFVSLLNGSITDGVILVTPAATRFSTTAPVVAIDPNKDCPDCIAVIAANQAGALTATEYLIGLGHTRIGFISGRTDLLSAEQRMAGYRAALQQAGILFDPDLVAAGDYTRATGYAAAQLLLALPNPPTAIFAANDESAMGAIEAARQRGRAVPTDLSVIGFDNIPEAVHCNPPLTTIDQFIPRMGYTATELLVGLIRGQPHQNHVCEMPTQLVVRDSCRSVANSFG